MSSNQGDATSCPQCGSPLTPKGNDVFYCPSCRYRRIPRDLLDRDDIVVARTSGPKAEPMIIPLYDPALIKLARPIESQFVTEITETRSESALEPEVVPNLSEPTLSEDQRDFLTAALRLSAFDSDSRCTARQLVKEAKGKFANEASAKKALASLVTKGLFDSQTGAKGGYWLTSDGRRRAERLASRHKGSAGA
jgi:hypothetical protein